MHDHESGLNWEQALAKLYETADSGSKGLHAHETIALRLTWIGDLWDAWDFQTIEVPQQFGFFMQHSLLEVEGLHLDDAFLAPATSTAVLIIDS